MAMRPLMPEVPRRGILLGGKISGLAGRPGRGAGLALPILVILPSCQWRAVRRVRQILSSGSEAARASKAASVRLVMGLLPGNFCLSPAIMGEMAGKRQYPLG